MLYERSVDRREGGGGEGAGDKRKKRTNTIYNIENIATSWRVGKVGVG
jgi:hypothetical protein